MRILVIAIMALGLPCSAFAGPVKAEKTASTVHADKLVGEVNVKPESRAKTVAPGTARVALVENGKANGSIRLLSREKQRLTVKQKKSATLIHISNPR